MPDAQYGPRAKGRSHGVCGAARSRRPAGPGAGARTARALARRVRASAATAAPAPARVAPRTPPAPHLGHGGPRSRASPARATDPQSTQATSRGRGADGTRGSEGRSQAAAEGPSAVRTLSAGQADAHERCLEHDRQQRQARSADSTAPLSPGRLRPRLLTAPSSQWPVLSRAPGTGVLVLTMHDDDTSVVAALRAGARGYLVKGADRAEIVRAVEAVTAGEAVYGPRSPSGSSASTPACRRPTPRRLPFAAPAASGGARSRRRGLWRPRHRGAPALVGADRPQQPLGAPGRRSASRSGRARRSCARCGPRHIQDHLNRLCRRVSALRSSS